MAKAVNTNLEFSKFGNKQITCRVHHAERWLDESQAKIKIAGRNVNNLGYADDTTLIAESKQEIKSLMMRVKEESEKAGLPWTEEPGGLQSMGSR